jgi:hypothetical protein
MGWMVYRCSRPYETTALCSGSTTEVFKRQTCNALNKRILTVLLLTPMLISQVRSSTPLASTKGGRECCSSSVTRSPTGSAQLVTH